MTVYQRFAASLSGKLHRIVLVLCILQPFLDVASYFLNLTQTAASAMLVIRMLLLCTIALLGFLLSERKWIYWCVVAVLGLFTAGHVLACAGEGYQAPLDDLANLLRIYQLPVTTIAFITFLRRQPDCLQWTKKGLCWCLVIIVAVELLSVITKTNPYTYPTKELGIIGWFFKGSAQSAIISMLVPVAVVCVVEKWQYHPIATAGIGALSFLTLYLFATRLSYAALLGTAFAMTVTMLVLKITQKAKSLRAAGVFFLMCILAVGFYSVSPAAKNTAAVTDNLSWKQEEIDAFVEADGKLAEAECLEGLDLDTAVLASAYEKYLPGLIERFGLARVARRYDYTTDAKILADARLEKLNYCQMLFADSGIMTRLFGAEHAQMYAGGENYDVENDFHGIYYLCGSVGLCLLVIFLLWFILRIAISLFRNFSGVFTLTAAGFGVALTTALAHAYFTSGVLRRPNVTFYLAIILAGIYAMTQPMKSSAKAKEDKL